MHLFHAVCVPASSRLQFCSFFICRFRQSHSWFCDPEKLLSPEEQSELEAALLKVRDQHAHSCTDGQIHHFQASQLSVN